jgi:hypothetical protein
MSETVAMQEKASAIILSFFIFHPPGKLERLWMKYGTRVGQMQWIFADHPILIRASLSILAKAQHLTYRFHSVFSFQFSVLSEMQTEN